MTPSSQSSDALLTLLERERSEFLNAFSRVPAAHQGQRPSPDVWSAVEVLDHVTRVERGVVRILGAAHTGELPLGTAEKALNAPLPPVMVEQVRDRTNRREAPERVRPTGVVAAEAALEALSQSRAALLAAYQTATPEALDGSSFPHPFFGPLTPRAWVELTAHHDARHAGQLAELAEKSGARPGPE